MVISNLETEKKFLEQLIIFIDTNLYESSIINIEYNSANYFDDFLKKFVFLKSLLLRISIFKSFINLIYCYKTIKVQKPELLILGNDNSYLSVYFIAIAKILKITSIVFPFSMSNKEEILFALSSKPIKSHFYNFIYKIKSHLLIFFYPKWVHSDGNNLFICYSLESPYIFELLRISPRDPWVICGGNSDYVFVNSEFERDYYVKSGVPRSKIRIYALDESENASVIPNLFVWSVPPDHINSGMFESYDQMIEFHLDLFSLLEIDVQISLHPRIPTDYFLKFKLSKRIHVSNEPIHTLLKRCEYFIASQSATIRFALRENKHVINFCIYGLPYTEYSGLSIVSEVNTIDQFREIMTLAKANRLSKNDQNVENHSYYKSSGKNLNEMLLAVVDKK